MKIEGSTILVTGASGGIGSALVDSFLKRGAESVYAADIADQKSEDDRIIPVKLDVTIEGDVKRAAKVCGDIDILVNNAGIELKSGFIDKGAEYAAWKEMQVNYFGVHRMCSAFWPVLLQRKSSAIVNILSIGALTLMDGIETYCASKAAAHFLTKSICREAHKTGISVMGVYPGYVDTQMVSDIHTSKMAPYALAEKICTGIENGEEEIFPV